MHRCSLTFICFVASVQRSGSVSMSFSILYMRYSKKFRMPTSLSTSLSWICVGKKGVHA